MRGAFPCYHGANNNANDRQEYEAHYRIDDLRRRRAGARRQRQGRLCAGRRGRRHRRGRGRTGRQVVHACPHHEVLEPSPDRIQSPCPFVGICGGCSWGNLSRTAQLAAKEQNLRSTLERIGKFSPDQVDELVQPIRHTKDDWGYRNKIELEPTVVNGRVRLGMHGVDPRKIVTVDSCPLFDKRFPKALKSVVGALNYLSGSHDLGLERVGIRASRRTKALEVALWTPTGSFPRSQVSRVLADAAHPTSVVRVMSKGEKKARRVSKVEMLAGEVLWTENIAEGQMRLSAPSFFQVNTKGAEILIELVMETLDPQEDELAVDLYCGAGTFTLPLARRCDFVARRRGLRPRRARPAP